MMSHTNAAKAAKGFYMTRILRMAGTSRWVSLGVLGAIVGASAWAQEARKPSPVPVTQAVAPAQGSLDDIAFAKRLSNAFKGAAKRAEPSVVNITQLNRVLYRQGFFDAGRVEVRPTGLGSGFIVSSDGYIVTNNHVVAGAAQLKVKMTDGQEYDAKLIGRDEATDLAVIKLDPKEVKGQLVPLDFGDSETLDVGEWVVAIGSPFGLSSTVTAGIVSAKGRSITPKETGKVYEDFIQTDAAINPGNSGGPLLNLQGEVVGINSAIASRTGGYEGIGFAIPSNIAKAVMDNIIAHGKVVRGWMGVDLAEATPQELAGVRFSGASVKHSVENSPAEKGGLKEGDVITKFNGKAVNEARLRADIAITAPGTPVQLEVLRDGKPQVVTVTLGDQNAAQGNLDVPELGMTVRTISPQMARQVGAPKLRGVVIVELDPNGRAARDGARVDDIIVGIDGKEVTTAQQLAAGAGKANFEQGSRLNVIRENMRGYLDLKD
jgi:serine protease Do